MSVQEILVVIIILTSVTYTVYSIVKIFSVKPENSCGCSSCDIKSDTKDIRSLVHKKLQ
ncbi:MAG: FeoB-associated Cys-rich membrane protein [Bacteroidales bacterium]|nr:FeoB-associated Cys-rich membrane protein [Bacteroidales bacterium]